VASTPGIYLLVRVDQFSAPGLILVPVGAPGAQSSGTLPSRSMKQADNGFEHCMTLLKNSPFGRDRADRGKTLGARDLDVKGARWTRAGRLLDVSVALWRVGGFPFGSSMGAHSFESVIVSP